MRFTYIILLSTWLISLSCLGSDWSQFRGPGGSGVAEESKPPTQLDVDSNLKWKTALAAGHSSPIHFRDRLILTGFERKEQITYAINIEDGSIAWEQRIDVQSFEQIHRVNTPATSTAVTDGKWVYIYFPSFGLLAYDYDGVEQWRRPLPMVSTPRNQGSGTSPVIAGDILIIDRQLRGETHLLAVRKQDGAEVWKAPRPLNPLSFSTPVIFENGTKRFVGMASNGIFTAYALEDGEPIWWVSGLGAKVCATPVFVDDVLYVSTAGDIGNDSYSIMPPVWDEIAAEWDSNQDGVILIQEIPDRVLAIDRKNSDGKGSWNLKTVLGWVAKQLAEDGFTKEEWSEMLIRMESFLKGSNNRPVLVAIGTGGEGDVSGSHVLWKESKRTSEVTSPVVYQNRIYIVRSGGILNCRDAETGKTIYDKRIDAPGGYFSSPIAANNHLYVANDRGEVSVIKTGEVFQLVSKSELGEPIAASPAIIDDTIIFRSSENLWAFSN